MAVPMEPPTWRIQRVRATQVAMEVSGVAIIATVAAGTMIPPTPKLLRVPRAIVRAGVSGVMDARAPVNTAYEILVPEQPKVSERLATYS